MYQCTLAPDDQTARHMLRMCSVHLLTKAFGVESGHYVQPRNSDKPPKPLPQCDTESTPRMVIFITGAPGAGHSRPDEFNTCPFPFRSVHSLHADSR